MPAINFESITAFTGPTRVYTRQFWADSWVQVENLWPNELSWTLLPDPPTASFRSDYGPLVSQDDNGWRIIPKLNVLGWYVKVEVDCPDGTLTWIGFIDDVVDYQGGIQASVVDRDAVTHTNVPFGRYDITAYAMTQALSYETIYKAYWWDGSAKRESGSAIAFNANGKPNRTATVPGSETSHLFSPKADAEFWSSRDIVSYLIAQHPPKKQAGSVGIPFDLINGSILPDWDQPVIDTDRVNVWELLEQLIDRRLFLAASVGYNGGTNTNELRIHSLSPTSATLGGGRTLTANTDLLTIACVNSAHTSAVVRATATSSFQRVVARGAKRTSTATLKINDGLYKGWDSAQATEYSEGGSTDAAWATADSIERRRMNATVRASGELDDVFRHLILKDTDDYTLSGEFVFATDDVTPARHYAWPKSIEILPQLALLAGVDYSGTEITSGLDLSKAGAYRLPLIAMKIPNSSGTKRKDVTKIGQLGWLFGDDGDAAYSVDVLLDEDGRGIRLNVVNAPQHAIAGTEFVGSGEDSLVDTRWDIGTTEATLTLLDDRFAEGKVEAAGIATADQVRTIVVDVGQGWRRDFLVKNTTVDIKPDSTLRKNTDKGFVRDDSEILASFATLVGLWFLVPRNLLTVSGSRPSAVPAVGQLVTTLNAGTGHAVDINTIVSQIVLRLPMGENGPAPNPDFQIQTAASVFDPSIL